jgi:hypothetical protein
MVASITRVQSPLNVNKKLGKIKTNRERGNKSKQNEIVNK